MKEGRASPTPHAVALGCQRPRCGGARQQRLLCVATATPQSRRGGAQAEAPLGAAAPTSTQGFLSSNGHASSAVAWRRLKAFSQHGAWSRRPSWRKLAVSSYRLRHHPRCLVLLQTGPRQVRGPLARAPRTSRRNDRPSPHSVLVHTSTHSPAAPGRKASSCRSGWQAGWLPVADSGGRGPLPFKAKEFVSCYLSI